MQSPSFFHCRELNTNRDLFAITLITGTSVDSRRVKFLCAGLDKAGNEIMAILAAATNPSAACQRKFFKLWADERRRPWFPSRKEQEENRWEAVWRREEFHLLRRTAFNNRNAIPKEGPHFAVWCPALHVQAKQTGSLHIPISGSQCKGGKQSAEATHTDGAICRYSPLKRLQRQQRIATSVNSSSKPEFCTRSPSLQGGIEGKMSASTPLVKLTGKKCALYMQSHAVHVEA